MKRLLLFTAAIFLLFPLYAQEKAKITIESISGPKPYTSLDLNNDPGNFQFAIVSDRTGGHRPGIFLKGIQKLNLLQPEFVLSVGDLIEGYTEDVAELDRQWKEFNGFIDELQVPFFYVPGNHDITNKVMETKWEELFGKTYYHFVYQDVLFLCLNSEDNYRGAGRGTIGDEQYEYIKKVLDDNKDVKWTLLFLHQPLWDQEAETLRWPDVEKLLDSRKHTVYAGHRHSYVKYERNNGKYFILATTGGGSALRGPELGEFDHVTWITMTPNGPVMANLMLEGIWGEDLVTEEMKDYFSPLLSANAVSISPIMLKDEVFEEGQTTIKLTNDRDVPMEVELELLASPGIASSFTHGEIEVAPNSVEMIEVEITAVENMGVDDIAPFEIEAEISYVAEGKPEIEVEVEKRLKPERMLQLTELQDAVKIDGNLDEWEELSITVDKDKYVLANPFSHQGKADGSFKFDVAYDETFLYVGAKITDDEMVVSAERNPLQKDGFTIALDPRVAQEAAGGTGDWGETAYFITSPPTKKSETGTTLYQADRLPEGTQVATKLIDGGFAVELAIPLAFLKEKQSGEWNSFRLNAAQIDVDNDGSHQSTIFWKPDWRGEDNYLGSGIFMK